MSGYGTDEFRDLLPKWCSGCGRALYPDDPHDEGCKVVIQDAADAQRSRRLAGTPGGSKIFYLVYGLFAVAILGVFIFWQWIG